MGLGGLFRRPRLAEVCGNLNRITVGKKLQKRFPGFRIPDRERRGRGGREWGGRGGRGGERAGACSCSILFHFRFVLQIQRLRFKWRQRAGLHGFTLPASLMLARAELACVVISLLLASAAARLTDWRIAFENPVTMLASGSITISAFASYALNAEHTHPLPSGWYLALYIDGVLQRVSRVARIEHTFASPEAESLWIHAEVCMEDPYATRIACSSSAFFSVAQQDLPDDAPQDWKLAAPAGTDDLHLGTLGLHAVLALPAAVIRVLAATEHMGCFIGNALEYGTTNASANVTLSRSGCRMRRLATLFCQR
jgi:hypothetical protein